MEVDYFHHPNRFPKNTEGAFYTTGHLSPATRDKNSPLEWCGDCLWCEAPELEAPDLLAPLNKDNRDSYFVQQPATQEEIERACMALKACCVAAFRYGGRDRQIIERLGNNPELSDYIIIEGELQFVLDEAGEYLPFANRIITAKQRRWRRKIARRRRIAHLKQVWNRIRQFFLPMRD